MPSFDIVSEVNHVEIKNAVDQCNKEITNRFDFKGSDARVEIQEEGKQMALVVYAVVGLALLFGLSCLSAVTARVRLPERICSGTHAYWADAATLLPS